MDLALGQMRGATRGQDQLAIAMLKTVPTVARLKFCRLLSMLARKVRPAEDDAWTVMRAVLLAQVPMAATGAF